MSAIIYARVSSAEQAERDNSIPFQLEALRAYAAEHQIPIVGEYTDVATGRDTEHRDNLLQAITRARRDNTVSKFLVHKIDRFARNAMDFEVLRHRLKCSGVEFISITEQFEDSPVGHLMEQVMASFAEYYSANLSLEVRKGLAQKLKRGEWAWNPPYGYMRDGKEIVLDPERAPLIKAAFERFATGTISSSKLVKQLGFTTRSGKPMLPRALIFLLHNRFYCGELVLGSGAASPGKHEALISKELFEKVQQVFASRPTGGRHVSHLKFPLARKLPCTTCGKHLVGEEHRKKSKLYRYYRCHTAGCKTSISAKFAEDNLDTLLPDFNKNERRKALN